jgi:hypothetical protein
MPAGHGEVVLTAAGLSMTITRGIAGTSPLATPSSAPAPLTHGGRNQHAGATSPRTASPALHVTCVLAPGQRPILATVTVTGHKAPPPRHTPTTGICPPHGPLKLNPRFPNPKPQKGAKKIISTPQDGCAWVAGYSDVRKLKGAAFVGPALSDLSTNVLEFFRPENPKKHDLGYFQLDDVIQLEDHGQHQFPPSTATFLSFGFVPTSATMHILEIGTINVFSVGPAASGCATCQAVTTVDTRAQVRIDNVRVNGVPLNVGAACQTPQFDIVVVGKSLSKPPYTPNTGGPLAGMLNIPEFHGCGVGENLDPIFNAAISGKNNVTLLTQGVECTVANAFGCDPKTGRPDKPKIVLRKVVG